MRDDLKETPSVRNFIGVFTPKVVDAGNEFTAVASVRQSNLVGHPKGS